MKFNSTILLTLSLLASFISVGKAQASRRRHLIAPTYYISLSGSLEDSDTVKVSGATNLPKGSNIEVYVGEFYGDFGVKRHTVGICVKSNGQGFFDTEIHAENGSVVGRGQFAVATFSFDGMCRQEPTVKRQIGDSGQYLGNDNYDNSFQKTLEETPGLIRNPQIVVTSHLHFGLIAIARVM